VAGSGWTRPATTANSGGVSHNAPLAYFNGRCYKAQSNPLFPLSMFTKRARSFFGGHLFVGSPCLERHCASSDHRFAWLIGLTDSSRTWLAHCLPDRVLCSLCLTAGHGRCSTTRGHQIAIANALFPRPWSHQCLPQPLSLDCAVPYLRPTTSCYIGPDESRGRLPRDICDTHRPSMRRTLTLNSGRMPGNSRC
jgi:hypothetical protein